MDKPVASRNAALDKYIYIIQIWYITCLLYTNPADIHNVLQTKLFLYQNPNLKLLVSGWKSLCITTSDAQRLSVSLELLEDSSEITGNISSTLMLWDSFDTVKQLGSSTEIKSPVLSWNKNIVLKCSSSSAYAMPLAPESSRSASKHLYSSGRLTGFTGRIVQNAWRSRYRTGTRTLSRNNSSVAWIKETINSGC